MNEHDNKLLWFYVNVKKQHLDNECDESHTYISYEVEFQNDITNYIVP